MNDVFVHERALCESTDVGAGTRIWPFAHVMAGARVGCDCNIGEGAFVEGGAVVGDRVTVKNHVLVWNGVTVEDDAFLGPNAVFTNVNRPRAAYRTAPADYGRTRVGAGATVGANATVVAPVSIGRHAFVGAGSVVVHDVPDHALVVGNPARRIGWVCDDGATLTGDLQCPQCGRRYAEGPDGLVPA